MGTRYNRLAEAVLTGTHNLCFGQEYKNYQSLKVLIFLVVKFSIYSNRRVFIMHSICYPTTRKNTTEMTLLVYNITKTYLYNFDPLKPHFYIVKLGFTGVYIIFLISAQNIDCGYSIEPPRWGGSNEYPQSMFCAEIWKKYQIFFFIWKFSFFGGKIFSIFE